MNASRCSHKLIRLSHILSETTPSYGNRDAFRIRKGSAIFDGDSANTSRWEFTNNHIGTHIDVPFHFNSQGLTTAQVDTSDWMFERVILIDVPCSTARLIDVDDLSHFDIPADIEMLLIRTGYEKYRHQAKYYDDNPGLDAGLATYFRDNFHCLRCVGFDFISITSWKFREEGRQSHKVFLCPEEGLSPIIAIEDMALWELNSPVKWVVVALLIVEDGNGGPITVFGKVNRDVCTST